MKIPFASLLLTGLFLFLMSAVKAQHPEDSTRQSADTANMSLDSVIDEMHKLFGEKKKTYGELGINYLSNNVYLGRKDSSVLPYFIPIASYYHKSGLFISASFGYLVTAAVQRIDQFTIEGGYSFIKGNYNGLLSASKYFYNTQSTNVSSEIGGSVSYASGYDLDVVKFTLRGTLNIGSKLDEEGSAGIEHSFYLFKDNLDFTPTITANASTQNYYNNYYRKKRYTINRKGAPPVTGIKKITGTVENASAFKMLDYELSMPVNYKLGKFVFSLTPEYAIPVNAVVVDIQKVLENGAIRNSKRAEVLSNSFFMQLGLFYKF